MTQSYKKDVYYLSIQQVYCLLLKRKAEDSIYQGTSRPEDSEVIFSVFRVKLPSATACLTTQRQRQSR